MRPSEGRVAGNGLRVGLGGDNEAFGSEGRSGAPKGPRPDAPVPTSSIPRNSLGDVQENWALLDP